MTNTRSTYFLRRSFKFTICALALLTLFWLFTGSYNSLAVQARQYPYAEALTRPAWRPFSPLLRVVLPFPDKSCDTGHVYGMEHALLDRFVTAGDYKVRYMYANTCDEALKYIQQRRADIMIGFGGSPDDDYDRVAQGPALATFNPVIITMPKEADWGDLYLSASRLNRVNYPRQMVDKVQAEHENAILVDPATHALLIPLHDNLHTEGQVAESSSYHWFWRKDSAALNKNMQEFWNNAEVEELRVALGERYYGFMPDSPRQGALRELAQIITKRIGEYTPYIVKAAAEHNIDPLLLSAVIFQESRFNPEARSYTGVRGIMQLTSNTATMLNVDRLDPSEAIMGGARYLRDIKDSLEFVQGISEWDKWCLTLAGFNQGPTVLRRALRAADGEGTGQNWAAMRGYYGTLQKKGIAGPAFRAEEAVNYVESIRYYYYILSGLAHIARPEHENLTGLLARLDG